MSSVVCAFGDVSAGLGGLAWDLGEPGAVVLSEGQARFGSFAIEQGGDAATLQISAGEAPVEATLTPRTAEIALEGGPTATACAVEVRARDSARSAECHGQICRWADDPLAGAAIFRQLTIDAGEDTLLVITARGRSGATGHGEEQSDGWLIQGEEVAPYEESLISTQYDSGGDPTRIGLELWPPEADQTSRAAATRVSGSLLGGTSSGAVWAGFFRCHTGDAEGVGSYLLCRG
jgi:hypothetical protein